MKLKKIISQILVVAMIMSFVSAFAVIPSNASTSLSTALETLRANIAMLYVKGPAISSEAVKKMRIDGIPSEYDYEGGDYKIFTDRLKFEAYLASVDPYDDYFFTDKTSFINLFGGDVTFIDGYKWYKSASSAGVNNEDSLIKYNLSNLVMYASDVYAFCTGANDVFPENLDSNMITIVIEANENITKVINALKAQIGSDSNKPNNYKGEYLREYPSEAKGVYPYLDKEFTSNSQNKYKSSLLGYIDSSAYTKKTYTYAEVKANSASADALAAFEAVYNTYKAKSDAGRLYYDYLQDIESVNEAYAKLCDSLVSSSASSVDLTLKATAYNKLKAYVEFFDKWIVPNIDDYPTAVNILLDNITTAKYVVGFVRDEACFLNSILLTGNTSLSSLVSQIEGDISSISSLSGSISSNDITGNIDDVTEINKFIAEINGISDSKYLAEFTNLCDNANRISDIEASSFVYPAETFVSFNGKTIETPSVTVSFSLIKSAYESLIEVSKYEVTDLLFKLIFNTPYRLCSEYWNSTFDSTEDVDEAYIFYSLKQYYSYFFLGNFLSGNEGLSEQFKAVFRKINGTNNMVDVDRFFKAFVGDEDTKIDEYIVTIIPYFDDENVYQTLFETALSISEFDTNTYLGYLKTIANSVLSFFNLSSATSQAADGKSPDNDKNYQSDVLSGLFESCSLINDLTSISNIEMVIYKDLLDRFVKAALSDEGYQGYEKYCKDVFDGKNSSIASYITNNINSFNFLISARAANADDEYAYSKLDSKLISPLKEIVAKFDKTNYTSDDIIKANNIINTINESNNELTWQYCINVLNNLNSCYTAISTAVSGLNQKLIAAQALTKDSAKTTPYYSMLFNARDIAVSNAKELLNSENVTLNQVEYALENLNLVVDAITTYTKPSEKESVSADKLKAKIAEAQILLNRCENITSAAITALSTALTNANASYNANKDSFTETQLNNEVSQLNTAILNVRSSELLDSTLSLAIENATKNVGNSADYTEDTWKEYTNALTAANELAANEASKLEDCQKAFDTLKVAVDKLEKTETAKAEDGQPEQKNETETSGNSSQNESASSSKSSYLSDAQSFFDNAMAEFMQYMLSNKANNEKVTVWKDSLQRLKSAIDAKASETVIVENIVAVQLAKSYLPVSNPDTSDD